RYEFNDAYAAQLENAGMILAGRSIVENLVEITHELLILLNSRW
ncbi:MAG: hypothetical protein RL733_883, partial [Actinomycetota bacterium]